MWRRRLAETEAGLTAYVIERGDSQALEALLETKAALLRRLPPENAEPADWQRAFFAGQAAMERFVVYRFGMSAIAEFGEYVGHVYGQVSHSGDGGASEVIQRIQRQATCYESRVELSPASREHGVLDIVHCAIWDYRERARASGVELTLDSPCRYCTHLLSSMITSTGLRARHALRETPDGHGCRWEVGEAGAGTEEES
ncbi:hypothetical protein AB0I81_52960 [Nonomuraea sp. NPDC050404]|uniref:hypothetical protein n=1 Tax=Nonomuraea sp. NPDC050404 TaxID=3155783 RepID=UPI0033FF7530